LIKDYVLTILMTVMFIFSLLVGYVIVSSFNENFQQVSSGQAANISQQGVEQYTLLDKFSLFIYFGLLVGLLVVAWMTNAHPVFYVVLLLILVFSAVTLTPLIMSLISFEEAVPDAASAFPTTQYVASNLLFWSLLAIPILLIVLYAKSRQEGV